MMLDVFKGDGFSLTSLTKAINLIPYTPTRLGALGLFNPEPINTTTVAIEMQDGKLTLVPTAPRGAPAPMKNMNRRTLRNFTAVHLPQGVSLMADEIQGLRAYGSETETETAQNYPNRKMVVPRRDLDVTHEWQRMGAIKGQVLDADGTTVIYNFFTEFGVTQSTQSIAFSTATTKVLQAVMALKRKVEDKLGGVMMSGLRVICSSEFFDALTSHPVVQDAYKYQMSQMLRSDVRMGFEFGGVIWEEYRGTVGSTRFIAANKAYAIPEGVPDLFTTYFAPAPYMETVNTAGLPFYAKMENADFDKGINVEIQSNPLHMCTRPDAIVELTAT